MTIDEARKELTRLVEVKAGNVYSEDLVGLTAVVKLMWDHLDGRGVLSGDPWKGMQPLATSEEIKAEK